MDTSKNPWDFHQKGLEEFEEGNIDSAAESFMAALELEYRKNNNRFVMDGVWGITQQGKIMLEKCLSQENTLKSDRVKHMREIINVISRKVARQESPKLYLMLDILRFAFYGIMIVTSAYGLIIMVQYVLDLLNGGISQDHPLIWLPLLYGVIFMVIMFIRGDSKIGSIFSLVEGEGFVPNLVVGLLSLALFIVIGSLVGTIVVIIFMILFTQEHIKFLRD